MEHRWSVCVVGKAEPKGSTKAFMPKGASFPIVTSDNPKLKDWQTQVRLIVSQLPALVCEPGPVKLLVQFRLAAPHDVERTQRRKGITLPHLKRPDIDKLVRSCLDSLKNAGAYKDDAQVVEVHATKSYVTPGEPPKAWIRMESER